MGRNAPPTPPGRLWPFLVWLAVFYAAWATLVLAGGHLPTALANWPISLTMMFGSYVAGSTPMGGGTVAFPVLVLLFDQDPNLGRDFSFAIQSVGMTSASIYIVCTRTPVAWRMLRFAVLGSLVGTPLGIMTFAPHVPGEVVKVLFAVVWASFGLLTLVRVRELAGLGGLAPGFARTDAAGGLAVGMVGGFVVCSVTGVGIDMLIYCVLVLVRRADLRVAVPTSVILMSFNSLIGIGTKSLIGDVKPGVFENWLAAAPVVAVGAPLGALVVRRVGRVPTLVVVAVLCVGQFAWTYYADWPTLGAVGLALGLAGLAAFQGVFEALRRLGRALARPADGPPDGYRSS